MLPTVVTPSGVASSTPVPALILSPDDRVTSPLVDWEQGGIALVDTSQGLQMKNWRCWVDGLRIMAQAASDPPVELFYASGVSEVSLAFDQEMHFCVAYVQRGVARLRWFDPTAGEYVTLDLPGAQCPRVALDDKRARQLYRSAIVLAYLRDDTLYVRQQTDGFVTETLVRDNLYPGAVLRNIGMNRQWRLQFDLTLGASTG